MKPLSPLHVAAERGSATLVRQILAQGVDDIDCVADYTRAFTASVRLLRRCCTALHLACLNGHSDCVRVLLERGAGSSVKDESGWTPLTFAVAFGHDSVAELLLSRDSRVDWRDNNGRTLMHYAANVPPDLPWARREGAVSCCKILFRYGLRPDLEDREQSQAIHLASSRGYKDVTQYLVAAGASVFCQNGKGITPYKIALSKGLDDFAAFLLRMASGTEEEPERPVTSDGKEAGGGDSIVGFRAVRDKADRARSPPRTAHSRSPMRRKSINRDMRSGSLYTIMSALKYSIMNEEMIGKAVSVKAMDSCSVEEPQFMPADIIASSYRESDSLPTRAVRERPHPNPDPVAGGRSIKLGEEQFLKMIDGSRNVPDELILICRDLKDVVKEFETTRGIETALLDVGALHQVNTDLVEAVNEIIAMIRGGRGEEPAFIQGRRSKFITVAPDDEENQFMENLHLKEKLTGELPSIEHIHDSPDEPEEINPVPGKSLLPELLRHDATVCNPEVGLVNEWERVVYSSSQTGGGFNGDPSDLRFESRFESGNMKRAVRVGQSEYNLLLEEDSNTKGHTQWFYFAITNAEPGVAYKFNIINMRKPDSLFNCGMRPLLYSEDRAKKDGVGWRRCGTRICYYKNMMKRRDVTSFYTLTFTVEFPNESTDVYYLAYNYPYTYSDLQKYLVHLCKKTPKAKMVTRSVLCKTLAGRDCNLLRIGRPDSNNNCPSRAVIISGRVHPGESNASWMVKGVLDFLTSGCTEASYLLTQYVFYVVPMLNPDGVLYGNYRCGIAGVDLNRQWQCPQRNKHPTIFYLKKLIREVQKEKEVYMYCDFHGHSRKNQVFMYGCTGKNQKSSERLMERIFPYMLHKNRDLFSFQNCSFRVQKSKESTARVVVWREFGVMRSYTLEATFCGTQDSDDPTVGRHYTIKDFEEAGRVFCEGLVYMQSSPEAVSQCVEELEALTPATMEDAASSEGSDGNPSEDNLENEQDGEKGGSQKRPPLDKSKKASKAKKKERRERAAAARKNKHKHNQSVATDDESEPAAAESDDSGFQTAATDQTRPARNRAVSEAGAAPEGVSAARSRGNQIRPESERAHWASPPVGPPQVSVAAPTSSSAGKAEAGQGSLTPRGVDKGEAAVPRRRWNKQPRPSTVGNVDLSNTQEMPNLVPTEATDPGSARSERRSDLSDNAQAAAANEAAEGPALVCQGLTQGSYQMGWVPSVLERFIGSGADENESGTRKTVYARTSISAGEKITPSREGQRFMVKEGRLVGMRRTQSSNALKQVSISHDLSAMRTVSNVKHPGPFQTSVRKLPQSSVATRPKAGNMFPVMMGAREPVPSRSPSMRAGAPSLTGPGPRIPVRY